MASLTEGAGPDLVIAGGGPAGMIAGLLFARAGCKVEVLEKHVDFFRDFRGDTTKCRSLCGYFSVFLSCSEFRRGWSASG